MQRPFSDADLLAYSREHVWYEVWMFFEMVDKLGRGLHMGVMATTSSGPHASPRTPIAAVNSITPPPGTSAAPSTGAHNAYLEAFMAHLRNLVAFLTELNPAPTDVAAVDFCKPGVWQPMISQTLKDAKRRVSKELAHLTIDRISGFPARKSWDFDALAAELRPLLIDFTAKADPARLSHLVRSAIR